MPRFSLCGFALCVGLVLSVLPLSARADVGEDMQEAAGALRAREFARAVELFTKILLNPDLLAGDTLRALRNRGHAYHELRQFRLSVADYSRAIDLRPGLADLWNSRCWARIFAGQPRTAVEDCDVALKLDPRFGAAMDSRAVAYAMAGDYDKALADHKRALERAKLAEHYYNRGITYERKGDRQAAERDFAEARKRASDEVHWERIEREMAPLRKPTATTPAPAPAKPQPRRGGNSQPDTRPR